MSEVMAMATFSKVFILDKYFSEYQKFKETEKKLQGMQIQGKKNIFLYVISKIGVKFML